MIENDTPIPIPIANKKNTQTDGTIKTLEWRGAVPQTAFSKLLCKRKLEANLRDKNDGCIPHADWAAGRPSGGTLGRKTRAAERQSGQDEMESSSMCSDRLHPVSQIAFEATVPQPPWPGLHCPTARTVNPEPRGGIKVHCNNIIDHLVKKK